MASSCRAARGKWEDGGRFLREVRATMKRAVVIPVIVLLLLVIPPLGAIDHLVLNPNLDYNTDSLDGPLITGDDEGSGEVAGKPNYVIIYGEACYNSKRQARRTVELYERYRGRVHFVVIDTDLPMSEQQTKLYRRYFRGYIPHVVVLNSRGKPLYDHSGEVNSRQIEELFDRALNE